MIFWNAARRRLLSHALISAALACGVPAAQAADSSFPTRPVRLVVGYAAGGATDVLARLVAQKMGEALGQPIVVENRAGANSNVGAEVVAKATPDGYTLYVFTIANTINATLYDKLGYDPVRDFEPVGMIAKIPNVLVVNPKLPIKTVADYVRLAKESPDGVTFASSGSGSSIHLSGEMFRSRSGANMLHVPYKGSAPAVTDLLGGQVQSMFDNAPSALPHVKSGKLRAIAVTSAQRMPQLPDVPTVAESGLPGFDVQSWFSIAAPAGTPKPVIDKLNTALNKALNASEVRERMRDLAATPEPGTPEQLRTFAASEIKRWHDVVKQSGARVN
ncbi:MULTISPECIES: Bug family tripartite tricarboxylate transporter substrate binding protein [Cupriavidus]|jgi:tripartite-type tricarboxylate transporter receptor subunit TctC|uniref:Tripartite tricarboxylate transporter substrate binding protein n=1 Tax=Cupriavidus metallidurans TaxID=119219 RepID=A0A482IZI9_9BURK|nr:MULTISPECIES: tripartite tricarboxylate transporter substrate binding protein [Cupriavidus]KWR73477.1 MFS transporter [Cupriavidus sp. SHE]QBP13332.1 tripartite tricarboxylate transporter substrate binding protein [Cupriavidus metallidurans]QWC91136.1 tripartite tricarboxylate transporter substrate binding protein [Cupriavidus metallidurans]